MKIKNYEKYAVAYTRYSSENQRDGYSIEAQESAIKEYALKNGITTVRFFSDEAKTGKNADRNGLKELKSFIKQNAHISVVLCHKRDRVFRNFYEMARFVGELNDLGVKLTAASQDFGDGKEALLLEIMTDGMSAYYSLNLADETMKGLKQKAKNCEHCGGKPLWGYGVGLDKKYVINEKEAFIIRELFERYANGESLGSITDDFNKKGYKNKFGRSFGKNSLHDTLKNEKYSGVFIFNRVAAKNSKGKRNNSKEKPPEEIIRIEDGMPAIVDKETFARVQQKIKRNRYRGFRSSSKRTYLLSGRIYCGECKFAMSGNCHTGYGREDRLTYRCSHRAQTKLCDNKEISLNQLEHYVLDNLKTHLFTKNGMTQIAKQLNEYRRQLAKDKEKSVKNLETRLKQTELEIENLVYAMSQGKPHQAIIKKLDDLEEAQKLLQAEIEKRRRVNSAPFVTEEQIQNAVDDFEEFIKSNFNLPECRQFIQQYVERVDVYMDYIEVTYKVAFSVDTAISPALQIKLKATRDEVMGQKRRKKSFAAISEPHNIERISTDIVVAENEIIIKR